MTTLAEAVYQILRTRVPCAVGQDLITYGELCARLHTQHGSTYSHIHPRSVDLHSALGEIVAGCQNRQLPALPAIVVREDWRTPGPGYYPTAHPLVSSDDIPLQMAIWGLEAIRVRGTTYPATL